MDPANVISTLVKLDGVKTALGQLKGYDSASRKVAKTTDQMTAATDRSERSLFKFHSRIRTTIGTLTGFGVGVGIAAVGIEKIGAATIDFDKAMRNVNSIAQLSEKQFQSLEKRVLSLAGKTAQAPQTLAEGLYDLVSSGFNANDSMKILTASAKAATAGLTDTATSTHAVASVLNAYHLNADQANKVSDTLFQTVNRGVINFEQLSSSIGDVLPFAATLHINLQQVGAAVSTMTKEGINGFETMTRLKSLMEAFLAPSTNLAKAIKDAGFQSGEALIKHKGLQGALEAVIKTTDGSKSAIAGLFPNVRALGGALALTGANAKTAHGDLKAFANVSGATNKALAQQSKSVSYQWNKLKDTISALVIQFATKAVPVVMGLVGAVEKFVQGMENGTGIGGKFANAVSTGFGYIKDAVKSVIQWVGGLQNFYLALKLILGVFIAYEVVVGIMNAVSLAMNPMVLAAVAVAAVALLIAKNWKTIGPFLIGLWKSVQAATGPIVQWIQNAWGNVVRWVTTAWHNASAALGPTITNIGIIFRQTFRIIGTILSPVIQTLKDLAHIALAVLAPAFQGAVHIVGTVIKTLGNIFRDEFNIIRDIIQIFAGLFTGDFGKMWDGIKKLFGHELKLVVDVINGAWNVFYTAGKYIMQAIGSGIDAVKNTILKLMSDFINLLLVPINIIWHDVLGNKKLSVNFGGGGGGGTTVAPPLQGAPKTSGGHPAGAARGGIMTAPGYIAGEEAPVHPEVILATNPAYRQRNLALWAQAGNMLGIPGFKGGGILGGLTSGISNIVSNLPNVIAGPILGTQAIASAADLIKMLPTGPSLPGIFAGLPKELRDKVANWIKSNIGGGPSGGGGPVPSGSAKDWLTKALNITNHFSAANLSALYSRMMQESGGNPRAINLWDSNAAAGHPSKGLLQTIDSTFAQYALPGYGDIWNPIDNAIAAIRYMFARYGHIVGASNTGYARGGIFGRFMRRVIPRFKYGGIAGAGLGVSLAGLLPTATAVPSGGTGGGGGGAGGGPPVDWRTALGIPPLPSIPGKPGSTVEDAIRMSGKLNGLNTSLAGYQHQLSILDTVYNVTGITLLDSDGNLIPSAVSDASAKAQTLIDLASTIFNLYGQIIVYTQRLAMTYMNIVQAAHARKQAADTMVRNLQEALAKISTEHLKGKALTAAKKRQKDLKNAIQKYQGISKAAGNDITKYSGKRSDLLGGVTQLMDDRDSAWIDQQQRIAVKTGILGTTAQPTTTTTDTTGTGGVDLTSAYQTIAQTAQTMYNVSQAQYKVFQSFPPYLGAAASGGMVTVGERGPELVHLPIGAKVYPHGSSGPSHVHVIVHDGAVDPNKIEVIAMNAATKVTRGQARRGSQASRLPGGGR